MFIVALILSAHLAGATTSQTLELTGLRSYRLSLNSQGVQFVDRFRKIEFRQRECSHLLLQELASTLRRLHHFGPLRLHEKAGKVNFTSNGKAYHDELGSPRARFLFSVPDEMKRLQLAEQLACAKPQKKTVPQRP